MPLYDYATRDGKRRVSLIRPVDARNLPVFDGSEKLERITVPARIGVVIGGGKTPLGSHGDQVLRGYYREECKQGSRFRSEFSAEQIKRAWKKN